MEDVLVRLVLRPLWTHINQLFVEALVADGSIQRLADNVSFAKTISEAQLGIRVGGADAFMTKSAPVFYDGRKKVKEFRRFWRLNGGCFRLNFCRRRARPSKPFRCS